MRYFAGALLLLIPLALAGCAPSIQDWRAYGDDASCASYGITPVDPAYAQCRAIFAQARAQQQHNAMNALINHGDYLAQPAPYPPFVGPVGVLPPYLVNCRAAGAVVDCYSQIY